MTGGNQFVECRILDAIWGEQLTLRLYLLLLVRAGQEDNVWVNEVKVEKGQYIRSYSSLADDLQYVANGKLKVPSVSEMKQSIDHLEELGLIKAEETKYGNLFTILQDNCERINCYIQGMKWT